MEIPAIIGILNATPDSFFDGGKFTTLDAARKRVKDMVDDGAGIIDVGGESTGPTSVDVSLDEELSRVIPLVRAIREDHPDRRISVDTWKSEVARQALAAGATMINDVTAGRGDARMFDVVATAGAPIILMYAKDSTARTTVANTDYDDVIAAIRRFLEERVAAATTAGIASVILDPGLGHFVSSNPVYSWTVLTELRRFTDLGPVLVSPSRKSFLAGPSNLPVKERLPATIAANCLAAYNGASFIRTHDVRETRKALDAISAILR